MLDGYFRLNSKTTGYIRINTDICQNYRQLEVVKY